MCDDPVTISFQGHKELFMEARSEPCTSPFYGMNSVAHWESFQLGFMLLEVGYHALSKTKQPLVPWRKAKACGVLCETRLQAAAARQRSRGAGHGRGPSARANTLIRTPTTKISSTRKGSVHERKFGGAGTDETLVDNKEEHL